MPWKVRRYLDIELGIPAGLGDWLRCDSCGSLITPGLWGESAPCPACGQFPDGLTTSPPPETVLDGVVRICTSVLRGEIETTARGLAEMCLDECPGFGGA
jgi:hypothetical protein